MIQKPPNLFFYPSPDQFFSSIEKIKEDKQSQENSILGGGVSSMEDYKYRLGSIFSLERCLSLFQESETERNEE